MEPMNLHSVEPHFLQLAFVHLHHEVLHLLNAQTRNLRQTFPSAAPLASETMQGTDGVPLAQGSSGGQHVSVGYGGDDFERHTSGELHRGRFRFRRVRLVLSVVTDAYFVLLLLRCALIRQPTCRASPSAAR